MRELSEKEASFVTGGDGTDYNQVACQTSVAAATVASGLIAGSETGAAVGVLGISGTSLCQAATTYVGDAIGEVLAGATESYNTFMLQLDYSLGALQMYIKWNALDL